MRNALLSLKGRQIMTALLAIESPMSANDVDDYVSMCWPEWKTTTVRQTLADLEKQGAVSVDRSRYPYKFAVSGQAAVHEFFNGLKESDERHKQTRFAELSELLHDVGSSWSKETRTRSASV